MDYLWAYGAICPVMGFMYSTDGYDMTMPSGFQPTPGPFARAISAEIRSSMARRQMSGAQLARATGRSQSYLSKRLRADASFSANDVADICDALDEDLETLLVAAVRASRRP